ncbi:MAG: hypothetical protein ACRD7E_14855 [Bryobacteraceae bacterium]
MGKASSKPFSCCTPRVWGFYLVIFATLFGASLLLVALWESGQQYIEALLFTSLGVACLVNVARNRTLHCLITGPFFLLLAIALALREAGIWHVPIPELWPLVLITVSIAFLIEWKFATRARR